MYFNLCPNERKPGTFLILVIQDDRTALHEVCRSQCEDEEKLADIAKTLINAGAELDKKSSDVGGVSSLFNLVEVHFS